MNLQTYLNEQGITKYHLSKISGVPKTTLMDICSGKSSIEKCSAKTVYQLAQALGCPMESLLEMDSSPSLLSGRPVDEGYLEQELPDFLEESVEQMKTAWKKKEQGGYLNWDCDYCNLQSDINIAEVGNLISSEQAWYLRKKYLRIERPGELD
ncbi:MAG: transcriptional regulator [Faecousia sp.]